MLVLMLAVNDPAGTAIAFAKALNRHTEHTCRLVTLETRYNHGWDADLHLPDLDEAGLEEVHALLRDADVLHFHMTADEDQPFGPFLPRDHLRGKAVVHHHHGHPDFRGDPDKYRRKYAERNRRNLLVSTPDLLHLLPEARWQPNLVPQDDPRYLPMPGKHPADGSVPDHPVRLTHSPTRKDLKNTDDLLRAVDQLRTEGLHLELDLIDDAPHVECLRRKRRAHILFDHLQGYYGVSSIEGLSQGLPTIAGLDDHNRRHITELTGTTNLPWITTTPRNLPQTLRQLIQNPGLRDKAGHASRRFITTRWTDKQLAIRLAEFLEKC
ncbi:glycosyltransferase [Desulfohalovibrio reitneri]|uniref:glycosyltransferase n=1 Tax=Desulfohalovibrio reitneri TaxID=1307759 RepID=UPI0004A6F6AF|nr:glycosyltransferase [Desulfohalovibrio reitneri]